MLAHDSANAVLVGLMASNLLLLAGVGSWQALRGSDSEYSARVKAGIGENSPDYG